MTLAPVPFTSQTGKAAARNSRRLRHGHVLRQLIDIRDNLAQRLANPQVSDKDCAQLARAHKDVVQQIMDFQGHGKPRPVTARNDPDAKPRRAKPSVIDSIEPKQDTH